MITQARLKESLHYDPDTGVFTRRVRVGCNPVGSTSGHVVRKRNGKSYSFVYFDGRSNRAHNLVWIYVHGKLPTGQIDHIDGNGTNNILCNLRDVSIQDNCRNKKLDRRNKSGFNGVNWHVGLGKWRAAVRVDSKEVHLGYFESLIDAIATRIRADKEYGFHPNHGQDRPL